MQTLNAPTCLETQKTGTGKDKQVNRQKENRKHTDTP